MSLSNLTLVPSCVSGRRDCALRGDGRHFSRHTECVLLSSSLLPLTVSLSPFLSVRVWLSVRGRVRGGPWVWTLTLWTRCMNGPFFFWRIPDAASAHAQRIESAGPLPLTPGKVGSHSRTFARVRTRCQVFHGNNFESLQGFSFILPRRPKPHSHSYKWCSTTFRTRCSSWRPGSLQKTEIFRTKQRLQRHNQWRKTKMKWNCCVMGSDYFPKWQPNMLYCNAINLL